MSKSIAERIASRSATEKQLLELSKDQEALFMFVKSLDQVHLDGEGLVDSDIAGLDILSQSLSHLFLNRFIHKLKMIAESDFFYELTKSCNDARNFLSRVQSWDVLNQVEPFCRGVISRKAKELKVNV